MSGLFSQRAWNKIWIYRGTFLLGLANTLKTAVVALLIALLLGIIFGLMATSNRKILKSISRVYVEVIQNTPVLLQMCFLYYALAFSGHSPGIMVTGFLALGIYTGASADAPEHYTDYQWYGWKGVQGDTGTSIISIKQTIFIFLQIIACRFFFYSINK